MSWLIFLLGVNVGAVLLIVAFIAWLFRLANVRL